MNKAAGIFARRFVRVQNRPRQVSSFQVSLRSPFRLSQTQSIFSRDLKHFIMEPTSARGLTVRSPSFPFVTTR